MIDRVGSTVPNGEGDVDGEGRGTVSAVVLRGREWPSVTRVGLAKLFIAVRLTCPSGGLPDRCASSHSFTGKSAYRRLSDNVNKCTLDLL